MVTMIGLVARNLWLQKNFWNIFTTCHAKWRCEVFVRHGLELLELEIVGLLFSSYSVFCTNILAQ